MISVELPWPDKLLSPNARPHWSRKARAVKAAKHDAGWAALESGARVVLCELLLRGPQTTAELRTRTERMQPLTAEEIETFLQTLANRPEGALVRRLPRQRGQKEVRWAQLLTGEPAATPADEPLVVTLALPPEAENRMAALEAEVARLRNEIESLRQALGGN